MKYLWLFCLLLISCADNDKEYEGTPTYFEDISFLTTKTKMLMVAPNLLI